MSFWSTRQLRTGLLWTWIILCAGPGVVSPQVLPAGKAARRTVLADGDPLPIFLQPRSRAPSRWEWGRIVGIEENNSNEPLVYSIRGNDLPERIPIPERIRFSIPGAGHIYLRDVASGPDGSLALAGEGYDADGRIATFIAWISPDRKAQTVSRTWPYVPYQIAFAADGSLWAAGWIKDPGDDRNSQFNVLKRFDESGRLITTVSPRVRAAPNMGGDAFGSSVLRASGDRIGWLTNGMEYVEFSIEGRELDRFRLENFVTDTNPLTTEDSAGAIRSLAVSVDNEVAIGLLHRGKWSAWLLDRTKRTWASMVFGDTKEITFLRWLGFDGPAMVADVLDHGFARSQGRERVVRRYRISSAPQTN